MWFITMLMCMRAGICTQCKGFAHTVKMLVWYVLQALASLLLAPVCTVWASDWFPDVKQTALPMLFVSRHRCLPHSTATPYMETLQGWDFCKTFEFNNESDRCDGRQNTKHSCPESDYLTYSKIKCFNWRLSSEAGLTLGDPCRETFTTHPPPPS